MNIKVKSTVLVIQQLHFMVLLAVFYWLTADKDSRGGFTAPVYPATAFFIVTVCPAPHRMDVEQSSRQESGPGPEAEADQPGLSGQ